LENNAMKVAVCFTPDRLKNLATVERMAQAQSLYESQTYQLFEVRHGALAHITASERFSAVPLFRQGPQGNLLIISGVPIDMHGPIEQTLRTVSAGDYHEATRALPALDGAFAGVFWDNQHQKLVVVTDFLGMQPLYCIRRGGLFLLATELKGLGASGLVGLDLDPAGWGAFLSLGHFIGAHTSVMAVRRVEPGSILVYDPFDDSLVTTSYWHWPAPKAGPNLDEWDTGPLVDVLRQNIHCYTDHNPRGTLLLSGGFDSRLILALLNQSHICPRTLTVRHRRDRLDADVRFAVRIAKRLHADHELVTPPRSHYSSAAYLDYLIMNEVATPSLGLSIAQVSAYIKPDMQAVWEGVFPGYTLVPPHQPSGGFEAYLRRECLWWDSHKWQAAARVFAQPLVEQMYEAFLQCLDTEKARYPDDGFGVSEFIIRNRARNRTAPNPLQVYANHVLPFTPGLTKEFWGLVGGIPFEAKADFKLYLSIYQRHFPAAGAVPYCSGTKLVKGVGFDPSYYVHRYMASPFRRLGLRYQWWHPSALVAHAIALVDEDHPDLNAPAVQLLKRDADSRDRLTKSARDLLFYWQTWRWIMEGNLSIKRKDLLFPPGDTSSRTRADSAAKVYEPMA
jgi:glutamine amidotransferase-like protein/asparagine synthase